MSRYICLMVVALLAIAGIVVGQQETPSPSGDCQMKNIGDGVCDEVTNNREECGYDEGDCCECTCEGNPPTPNTCITFDCLDPVADCFSKETAAPSPEVEATGDDNSSAPLVVSSPRAATIILGLAALFAILVPLR